MTNPLEFFWKEDPLKSASELIRESHFIHKSREKEFPVNVSLLFLSALFLAFSKSLYGQAGFSFTQHLITSIILVFIGYIVVGVALIAWKPYPWVNNKLRCFFTCFIAALTVSLFLVYFSEPITDVGISFVELVTNSDWLANRLPNAAPALLFSGIGCVAVYAVKRREPQHQSSWKEALVFFIYWAITSVIFFFVAYDRGWFFDNVMRHISKIKLF